MRLLTNLDKQTNTQAGAQPARRWYRRRLRWPSITIDLSRSKHRRILLLALVVSSVVGLGALFGGYEAYHYAESSQFCGTICHPMESEFVRYGYSPHANVECTACHVGPGLDSLVKSKLEGTRELLALLKNSYSRPIKSPVHNLRPARETCEACHIPTSFQDNIIKSITHYEADAANTPVQSTLILKMGGWQQSTGVSEGIHWHITNKVYYITADEQRQVMLWIGAEQDDGSLKEYYARDMLNVAWTSFVEEARENGEIRLMDCIDCHNRTAHFIPPPEVVVDNAINDGLISTNLPNIRAKAVEALTAEYANASEAFAAIDGLADSYRVGNPGLPAELQADLDVALDEIKEIYSSTNFPDMRLNWRTNPNNERHTSFPGCFRCHDGKHAALDPSGNEVEIISVKCNLCHTVPIVGRGDDMLIEAPVVVGDVPASHSDFRWTIEHRSVGEDEVQDCYVCHGQGFCSNSACHNLAHPPDMLYSHADEYRKTGDQVCYTCHQDILCSRCHPGGIVAGP